MDSVDYFVKKLCVIYHQLALLMLFSVEWRARTSDDRPLVLNQHDSKLLAWTTNCFWQECSQRLFEKCLLGWNMNTINQLPLSRKKWTLFVKSTSKMYIINMICEWKYKKCSFLGTLTLARLVCVQPVGVYTGRYTIARVTILVPPLMRVQTSPNNEVVLM